MVPAKPAKQARSPKATKKIPQKPPVTDSWEHWHQLPNDPDLFAAGVEIGARVTPQLRRRPQLRIAFKTGGKEATVECVRLAMYPGPLGSFPLAEELARSPAHRPVKLPAEEHFFALNSYVAGIAEIGIGGMFALAWEAGSLPVGFNTVMQSQILRALLHVAPAAAINLYLWVSDKESQVDADSRREPVLVGSVKRNLDQILSKNTTLPPEVLARLAWDESRNIRRLVANHHNTPPEVLARLAGDADVNVRLNIAGNKHASRETLTCLTGDGEQNAYVQERARETLEGQKKNLEEEPKDAPRKRSVSS
ncbi:MAG: hypothetical protein RBG13Loki_2197 [Promethearchaeota archaeon CR_4]|nr:MAG: hypothetical protein RBG13Loki_2197 [Candidatus Lokiarchaeota archaeon CR_4]